MVNTMMTLRRLCLATLLPALVRSSAATSEGRIPGKYTLMPSIDSDTYSRLVNYAGYPNMAYKDTEPSARNASCPVKQYSYIDSRATDTQAAIFVRNDTQEIIVAIPGTASQRDWLTDFSILPVTYVSAGVSCRGCTVHVGILNAWNSIEPDVVKGVEAAVKENPTYNVYVSGHSLGAAIATLAFARLSDKRFNLTAAYAYAAPRVGNHLFADYIDKLAGSTDTEPGNFYRVTHAKDHVPVAPPQLLGYKHPRTEYWESSTPVTQDTTYRCPGQESSRCLNSQTNTIKILIETAWKELHEPLFGFPWITGLMASIITPDHTTYAGLLPHCAIPA